MDQQIMILFFNMWQRKYNNKQKGKTMTKEEKMFEDFKEKMFKEIKKFHKAMEKTDLHKDNPNFANYLVGDFLNFESVGLYYCAGDCRHEVKKHMKENLQKVSNIFKTKYVENKNSKRLN